jgi:hypothetical protein
MHIASPLVQVMVQPISIISILHMPIMPMLQVQTHIPFIMQHMETMPPCIMVQRLFIISAAVLSSHIIVHFIPPAIFSIFMVQRGIIVPPICGPAGIMLFTPAGIPIMPEEPIPDIIIPRSLVIVLLMVKSSFYQCRLLSAVFFKVSRTMSTSDDTLEAFLSSAKENLPIVQTNGRDETSVSAAQLNA